MNTLIQLRWVSFDWKETGKGSYGVIAQELEEVLPELVKTGEVKSVNYNGIIGFDWSNQRTTEGNWWNEKKSK